MAARMASRRSSSRRSPSPTFGINAEVRRVSVLESQTQQACFLGSPSIRVDGKDVEPGADMRTDYPHSCRRYQTSRGPSAPPEVAWIREELTAEESTAADRLSASGRVDL
jgi:hypothetical protein